MQFRLNLPRKKIDLDLPRVFYPGSSPRDNSAALKGLLERLTEANLEYLRNSPAAKSGAVPPLYSSGVVYGRTTDWDSIPALYARGYGDCKSLTCALVAEYRNAGRDAKAVFRYVVNSKGSYDFHILVQTPYGFEDPSKVLGMGNDENAWFRF